MPQKRKLAHGHVNPRSVFLSQKEFLMCTLIQVHYFV